MHIYLYISAALFFIAIPMLFALLLPAACYSNSVYTCNGKVMRVRKAFKC